MADEIALACVNDIKTKASKTALVGEKVFYVASEDDLVNEASLRKLPIAGVMYEGLRSQARDQQGLASDLGIAIVVMISSKEIAALGDKKPQIVQVLDQMRNAIKGTSSPTGHKWRFVMEIPIADLGPNMLYMQRWATATIVQ